jgi:hypothetical protein
MLAMLAAFARPVMAAAPDALGTDSTSTTDGSTAPGSVGGDEPSGVPPRPEIPGQPPEIERDLSKLPPAVARLREQMIEAAATGDPEKLRIIIDGNGEPPIIGQSDIGDPIGQLKLLSGDEGGREILAILIEVLDAPYVHVDIGTPQEMYIWPYFARYPLDKLTPSQLVELFKLVYAGDYEDMMVDGAYSFFRAGLTPQGQWAYFIAGN